MAAPTPDFDIINWDGQRGAIRWKATWTVGNPDNFSDQNLVNLDADLTAPIPTSVKIISVDALVNGDINVILEFDATTDQMIDEFQGQSDATIQFQRDYSKMPNGGVLPSNTGAAGFNGDILLTTENSANLDELNLLIVFERSTR